MIVYLLSNFSAMVYGTRTNPEPVEANHHMTNVTQTVVSGPGYGRRRVAPRPRHQSLCTPAPPASTYRGRRDYWLGPWCDGRARVQGHMYHIAPYTPKQVGESSTQPVDTKTVDI